MRNAEYIHGSNAERFRRMRKGWQVCEYIYTKLCLNGTFSCLDFMDVIMGDIPQIEQRKSNRVMIILKLKKL